MATRDSIVNRVWSNNIFGPLTHFFLPHVSVNVLLPYLSSSFCISLSFWPCLPQRTFLLGFVSCLQFSKVTGTLLGQSLCLRKEIQITWTPPPGCKDGAIILKWMHYHYEGVRHLACKLSSVFLCHLCCEMETLQLWKHLASVLHSAPFLQISPKVPHGQGFHPH